MIQSLTFHLSEWASVLLNAALMTVLVTLAALLIGAGIGALIAAAKLSHSRLAQLFGGLYTTVFRGVPELLVIYLFYYGGSSVLGAIGKLFGYQGFIGVPAFLIGAAAVGVISGAYQAEIYRGAFLSIARVEIEAAQAMGMSRLMRLRRIIAPQVLRFSLPGLGNVWQMSLKDSALISVTGLVELLRASRVAATSTGQFTLFFIAGCSLYLLLTSLSGWVFAQAESRTGQPFKRT